MIKVSTTGMVVSLKTDLRFPIPGQQGHGGRIIQIFATCCIFLFQCIRMDFKNQYISRTLKQIFVTCCIFLFHNHIIFFRNSVYPAFFWKSFFWKLSKRKRAYGIESIHSMITGTLFHFLIQQIGSWCVLYIFFPIHSSSFMGSLFFSSSSLAVA